ncbi:MAG: efflux RND transporter periplasmic adaptor subunit [Kofleriaceae bacterium]|nr:efflux RND transporter periplasmic adaptor subunit [Kofleriaceae bacterium]
MADVEAPKPPARRRRIWLLIALGLLVVVGALAAVKYAQIATLIGFGKQAQKMGPPPETVSTARSTQTQWESTLSAVGTVASVDSVAVSTELPGIVKKILFESGQKVKAGQVLVELDVGTEQAQLDAAKARQELAQLNHKRTEELVEKGALARQELDTITSQLTAANADVAAIKATIDRKIVRAPFAGQLGIRNVSVGQYLPAGTPVTTLDAGENAYVDFTLPQEQMGNVRVGMAVRMDMQGVKGVQDGKISAIDPTIEGGTRNVKLRAEVPDPSSALRPGMFGQVTIVLPEQPQVVVVPQTAIVHASYGDSVFVVEPKPADEPGMRETPDGQTVKVVRQQFVRLGSERGDFVAVLKGLEPNLEVVSAGAFKLRNGSPVVVDNKVQAKPELAPHVENR